MAEAIAVTVRYFAAAAEVAGVEEETITVAPSADAVRAELIQRYGAEMAHILNVGALLIDGQVSHDSDLPVVSRVDVLPPFAGG